MAKQSQNYYQLLGLAPGVTTHEIKKAYRTLVKSHHPDVDCPRQTARQRGQATERMMRINEAYATLIDKSRRAVYDVMIGAAVRSSSASRLSAVSKAVKEDAAREKYLKSSFNPARHAIITVLGQYKRKLLDLSQDIFDDQLLCEFEIYVNEVESTLLEASQLLSSRPTPSSLDGAVRWLRRAIAQAADGLDDLRRFCQNYDYAHLYMAENLFKIATEHSRKAVQEVKR